MSESYFAILDLLQKTESNCIIATNSSSITMLVCNHSSEWKSDKDLEQKRILNAENINMKIKEKHKVSTSQIIKSNKINQKKVR